MNQSQQCTPNQNYYPISVPSAIDNAQPSWLFQSSVQDSAPVQPGDNSGFIQPQSIYSGWSLQDNGKSPFQQLQQPSNSDPWVDVIDKRSGQIYYWNTQTHETTSLGAQKPSAVVAFQQQPHPQPMMFAPNQMNNTFVQSNCIPYAMQNTNYPVYADKVPSHMIQSKTFNSRSNNSSNTHAPRSKNYYGPSNEANIVKRKLPAEADTASSKRPALSEDNSNSALRYKCSYCSKLFKKLVGLEAHIKIVHPSDVSTLTFPLHEDSAGSTGVPFTKTYVAISTTTTGAGTANTAPSSAAPAPVTESSGMAEFQCLFCKKNFKSSIALKQHSAANHVDDPASVQPSAMPTENTFNCLQCSKSFSNSVAMEQHFQAKHGVDRAGEVSATSRTEGSHAEVAQPGGNVQDMATDSRAELQRKIEDGCIEEPAASSSGVALARADIHGEMERMDMSGPENSGDLDASSPNEMKGDVAASDHPSSQLRNDEPNPYATVTEDVAADIHQGGTDDLTLAREALQLEHGEIETSTGESLGAAEGNNSSSVSGAAPTHQALTCTLCNKTFKWPNHLKQHYTTKHQGFASPTTSAVSSHSVAVAVATPNSVPSANVIETPGSDEFRCKLCNKKLKNSIGLQQHLAMKHSQIE